MHPPKEKLKQLVESGSKEAVEFKDIMTHLDQCEFCREFCENYRLYLDSIKNADDIQLPDRFRILADSIYEQALVGSIIELKPLIGEQPSAELHLAADGEKVHSTGIVCLTTLCCEEPEIVLRAMRDNDKGEDYLQLLSDNPELISQVLLEIPERKQTFITDSQGRVKLVTPLSQEIINAKWQIKMPDLSLSLEPIKHDPEKVEYSREVILETERDDKVLIKFNGKTEGKQLTIKILQLEGQTEFESVRINITSKDISKMEKVSPGDKVIFGPYDPGDEIKIRLYQ